MPESEMSLPACLRDGLTTREQSLLTMARHAGGLSLIVRELDGIANVRAAAVEVDAAKSKAARILVTTRAAPAPEADDWPHTSAVTRRTVPQEVNGDHAEVEAARGPILAGAGAIEKAAREADERRAIARAKRERRKGARVSVSVERFQNGNGERGVVDAALDAADVSAEEADTIRAEADGAGSPRGDPPPASSASAEEGFEYERPDPAPREEVTVTRQRPTGGAAKQAAWLRREAIVEFLRENGPRTLAALAAQFDVQVQTVMTDLKTLAAMEPVGMVERAGMARDGGRGQPAQLWAALSSEALIEREAQLDEDPPEDATSDGGDPSAAGVESSTAAPELPAADPHAPCEVGGLGSEDSDAAPESPAPADPPASPPAPDDSPDTPPAREAEPDELGGVPPSQPSPDELADVVDRVKRSPEPEREFVVGDADREARQAALLRRVRREREQGDRRMADIAAELLEMGEEMARDLDGALPETLLRARYLAALLWQIEQGNTSPELLDRFERLAGLDDAWRCWLSNMD